MILPDLLAPNLHVVFCGTAPSRASASQKAYYAHPQNKFYRILHEAGFTPRQFSPEEYPLLAEEGIGLTDVNKTESGNDVDLTAGGFAPDALKKKILCASPKMLAFTSKRAAREGLGIKVSEPIEYGEQPMRIGATKFYVLPSTSGAAAASWDPAPWHELGTWFAQQHAIAHTR